jgi:DNA-binding response OmpR family regulator
VIKQDTKHQSIATVLVIEDSVLVRMAIAAYLRECGYRVVEAATCDEALLVLEQGQMAVHVLFSGVGVSGALDTFTLVQWVRKNRVDTKIVMAGSLESASIAAGQLCEEGPHLQKPYEPQAVEDHIRRLLAFQRSTEPQ